jgi:hypothetical protein
MKNLKKIKVLVEDFKSNNQISWIKFKTKKLWNKSKNLWKPIKENKEIIDLLDEFIINEFNFKPLGDNWSEINKEDLQFDLKIALSHNMIHGWTEWSKKNAKKLIELILESFEGEVRYFSNSKTVDFKKFIRSSDTRGTYEEYGVIIYDRKNICGIWISQHEDAYECSYAGLK